MVDLISKAKEGLLARSAGRMEMSLQEVRMRVLWGFILRPSGQQVQQSCCRRISDLPMAHLLCAIVNPTKEMVNISIAIITDDLGHLQDLSGPQASSRYTTQDRVPSTTHISTPTAPIG